MGGCGKCANCLNLYEEYGDMECRKDAIWLKFDYEKEEFDDSVSKWCDYYEEYPAGADDIPEELAIKAEPIE